MLDSRKKAEIFHDLIRQIVPSAQDLALCYLKLQCFVESVNESLDNSILFFFGTTRPRSDYSVGIKRKKHLQ
jgi:hypothetical protein